LIILSSILRSFSALVYAENAARGKRVKTSPPTLLSAHRISELGKLLLKKSR